MLDRSLPAFAHSLLPCFSLWLGKVATLKLTRSGSGDGAAGDDGKSRDAARVLCKGCQHRRALTNIKRVRDADDPAAQLARVQAKFSLAELRALLTPSQFAAYLERTLKTLVEQLPARFAACPRDGCGCAMEVLEQTAASQDEGKALLIREMKEAGLALGGDGQPPSLSLQHCLANRLLCRGCSHSFCRGCQSSPYHSGFNCAAYAEWRSAPKCRFCATPLVAETKAEHADVQQVRPCTLVCVSWSICVALPSASLAGCLLQTHVLRCALRSARRRRVWPRRSRCARACCRARTSAAACAGSPPARRAW
jgi:hypothetical protein